MNLSDHRVNAISPSPRYWPCAAIWAALFALAYTQSPDYYSNQHHYYLHGFAQAGVGNLDEDWLANTVDPTPVYSWFVANAYRLAGPFAFQVIYFLLLAVYFESIRRIVAVLPGFPSHAAARVLFFTLFIATHAAILRVASVRLAGVDYPWYLQAGLAAQYLLGPGLQPSAFGVLLVVSLAAFVNETPILAAALAAAAAAMHSTYLLPAGLLVIAYGVVLMRERRIRTVLIAGAIALALVLPVLIFNFRSFVAGDPEQLREARRIFAHVRIPHHTEFDRWFDWMAMVQIGVMLIGLVLIWRTRLFLLLAIPSVACTALAVVQVLTRSDSLALLFPWRFSVVLMPISVAIIFGKISMLVAKRMETNRPFARICGIAAASLAVAGIAVMALGLGYYTNDAELPLLAYVRERKQPSDVYLIPTKFPTIKKESPAGQSKTFAPPVRTGDAGIPVDFQRFRLSTGAPIYIDFKAPPYAAAEVLEWHERMTNAQRWYAERDWDKSGTWFTVKSEGVTHVVAPADKDIVSAHLQLLFGDENYRLYRIE
jgi:hypothetical protein